MMGKDFLRLVELAIASGALIIPGVEATAAASPAASATEQATGLVVRSAKLDRTGLTIEFSESLKPVSGVDPSKFRLSFAYYSKKNPSGYSYSYYYEYYERAAAPITVYSDVGRTALKSKLEQPQANRIRIPAAAGLDLSSLCKEIATAPSSQAKVGLYLHYEGGEHDRVVSEKGSALESIAPYWLEKTGDTGIQSGTFPRRPIPVTVACR